MNTIHQLEYAIEHIDGEIERVENEYDNVSNERRSLLSKADDMEICLGNLNIEVHGLRVMRDGLQSALDFCREHHPDRPNPNRLNPLL